MNLAGSRLHILFFALTEILGTGCPTSPVMEQESLAMLGLRKSDRWRTILIPTVKAGLVAIGAFALLGTVAALWENPFFVRMTATSGFEIALLALQSLLLGAYVAIPARGCALKTASIGGIANFVGVACPICNKLLLLVFGADALLTYLEPARIYLAAGGALITGFAVYIRWRSHRMVAARAPLGVPPLSADSRAG